MEGNEIETFGELGLDSRLVKALNKQNIEKPTMIQSSVIPFAMKGKDILAKAKTGSGKTLAYLLPILHRMLTEPSDKKLRALVLVPSRDLAKQICDTLAWLTVYCPREFKYVNLAAVEEESVQLQKNQLSTGEMILAVSTPSRVLPHLARLKEGDLEMLVIDEADLILGFGYGQDMDQIASVLPSTGVQSLLLSASITGEVEDLKSLILRSAVTIKLEDDPADSGDQPNLKQFTISCSSEDKFLLIYVILKLQLLKGKILIFVNDVDRSYRLKIFLEQFGIKSCVVNAELPLASRHSIIEEFNRGVYDLLIASDQAISINSEGRSGKKRKVNKRDDEGMAFSRGIDFKRIDVVLNFDFPSRLDSYVHRVGRTARAGSEGTAISFVTPEDEQIQVLVSEDVADRTGEPLEPYAFDMSQVEGFRYRCQDAMRSVTGALVKESRLKDLKKELVNSEKLKSFFADRPKDLEVLMQHDKSLLDPSKMKPHLKHVPDYLNPNAKPLPQTEPGISNRQKKLKSGQKFNAKSKKRRDPLKSIKAGRFKK